MTNFTISRLLALSTVVSEGICHRSGEWQRQLPR